MKQKLQVNKYNPEKRQEMILYDFDQLDHCWWDEEVQSRLAPADDGAARAPTSG